MFQNKIIIDLINRKYLAYHSFLEAIVTEGYVRVNMVLEPGEFAVRGTIIDVFPVNHSHPIRIEYFDDDIERLSSFNLHNQRSISSLEKIEIFSVGTRNKKDYFQSFEDNEYTDGLISDICDGDYVVHEIYGVGVYQGLKRLTMGGYEGEYVFLRYKGTDKLYVPINNLCRLHKYDGGGVDPKINSLSDGSWDRIKKRVKNATQELAEDIYILQKIRNKRQGFSFSEDTVWQIDLEQSFIHKDTQDQIAVTQQIKNDMEASRPMDRLICGDVGYGKTEILVRAAFKAIEDRKQVAIIVPTTLLAEQHYRTFKERLELFPYCVEALSRFKPKKEQAKIKERIKSGGIDIIIGTHRLLQKDIEFQNLGLLIVDEEQQFGVTHKEKIKQIKKDVDVITVSATPIPRTLYMALTGAKDFSSIETPPISRKPVLTNVGSYSDELVVSAVMKELERNGQVFYVHNQVQTLTKRYRELKKLFPKVEIVVAHGQMKAQELQKVFYEFLKQKSKILLCTTIIGYGVDIPNVNTIIIDMPERLGLSQIHQLRGRVGRTNKQAFAYLLYKDESKLTEKAKKRLRAIKEYTALGSGYKLALKDLEIRGAGTLLGHRQHGHMTAVGFELYCKLLSDSVAFSKNKKKPLKPVLSSNFEVKAFIPDKYISDPRERLSIYKRIMDFEYKYQMEDLRVELEDRYGSLPKMVLILFESIVERLA
jgi:transcription-repair coupling factor (superfamily II helicase)